MNFAAPTSTRVLLVEQVYRAQSLLLGHPYHRD